MEKERQWYLAVDIGGTAVKIGLVDRQGDFGRISEYNVNFDNYETPILETVLRSCELFLQECGVELKCLQGIGVGATGYINTVRGTVDGGCGFIRNWEGSQVKERMEAAFHVPTFVLNDANAAALGEVWLGAGNGCRNVVVLTIGTGVGGGIIIDSRLLLGKSGFAGEIGHMVVRHGGHACPCGNEGCLERYASVTALVEMVREAMEKDAEGAFAIGPEEINGRWIFKEVEKGNQRLGQIVDQWIDYIVSGIVSLCYIFNPEMVVIGGGVSAQQSLFIDKVRNKVLGILNPQFGKGPEIRAATLANRSGMAGAAYYCMQCLENR